MTLLFISLLPCNSGGLDLGLSCFFMWLLCFLVGWRSWPECQCPRIRYCTLPGEVESEMPCFSTLTPLPNTHPGPLPPSACILQPPLGKRKQAPCGNYLQVLEPHTFRFEDLSSPRLEILSSLIPQRETWSVLESPAEILV